MPYETITLQDSSGYVYSFRVDDVNFLSIGTGNGYGSGIYNYNFKIHLKTSEPLQFAIYRWERDDDIRAKLEMDDKDVLCTEHIKLVLYVLKELKSFGFLEESEYKIYLDRIEEIICEYYDNKTDEMEKKLNEFDENLNELETDRNSSEILEDINRLVNEVEQNRLDDASI
jgi:hypothetical protein